MRWAKVATAHCNNTHASAANVDPSKCCGVGVFVLVGWSGQRNRFDPIITQRLTVDSFNVPHLMEHKTRRCFVVRLEREKPKNPGKTWKKRRKTYFGQIVNAFSSNICYNF